MSGNPFEDPTSGGTSSITFTTEDATEDPDTTAGDGGGSTSLDDTAGDDTTGGEVMRPGQTHTQLVSSGGRTASTNYSLVYTLGQPSQLQTTHSSTNYRMQGGLVGANGSPP